MSMEDNSVFVDTNILVYCNNKDSPYCKPARERLGEFVANGKVLFVSDQVLREYLVIMTRPGILEKPISPELAVEDIRRMQEQFNMLFPDDKALEILSSLIVKYGIKGKRVHDVAIVSLMLANNISQILINNVVDFEIFHEITVYSL